MFLNETLVLLTYTASMMATLPNETEPQNTKIEVNLHNLTTTTLSPEEEENKFNFEDGKSNIYIFFYPAPPPPHLKLITLR